MLTVPASLREKLKKPLGILIKGTKQEILHKIKNIIKSVNARKIITVGDMVSNDLTAAGIYVDLCIIDEKTLRKKYKIKIPAKLKLTLKNPAGTLNINSFNKIKKALKSNMKTLILVEGEEDLLTIPSVIVAPKNSIVIYGQPNEGVVLIKVKNSKKKKFNEFIKMMGE